MEHIPKTMHLASIVTEDINMSDSECDNALGPLSSSFPPYSATHRKSSISEYSGGSFTSNDFKRSPQEAANMEFRGVGPGEISMIHVLSKQEYTNGISRSENEKIESPNGTKELKPLEMSEERDEKISGVDICKIPDAKINVNGESYILHRDGVFRPKILNMSIKEHFKGYAVRANGIFKPLGGSPAAIDASILYRVTPVNKYSFANRKYEPRALHRIKSVQELLLRGTSGHEEYMYVYNPHWEGFIRTEEKLLFPSEKPMLKPGSLRGSFQTDSEGLFTSVEDSLQKADRYELTEDGKRRSLAPNSQVAEKALLQVPRPPKILTRLIEVQSPRIDEELQGSWLNIDSPQYQIDSQIGNESIGTKEEPYMRQLPPVSDALVSSSSHQSDVIGDSYAFNGFDTKCASFSPMATAFHKSINHILGAEAPQIPGIYTPTTLQQPVNECVLVLCLYGSGTSKYPKIARMSLPNNTDFSDMDMFLKMREEYNKFRGFWRRQLSLRGLKRIDIVECRQTERCVYPTSFRIDDFSPEKLLECYLNPYEVAGDRYWVEWVHRLGIDEDRYALEFVEGWRSDKILAAGVISITISITSGVLWSIYGPEHKYLIALVLGIFVVILGWSIICLLAVLSYSV